MTSRSKRARQPQPFFPRSLGVLINAQANCLEGIRNDANEARIPHTDFHTHPREARPRAPRQSAGPVRGDQHRGLRGSELWSIDLQLVVISPARPRSFSTFSTSPLGQSPCAPSSNRPRDSAAQSLRSPRQGNAQIAGNKLRRWRPGDMGATVLCQVPDRQATSARSEASQETNKKQPRDQGLLEQKGRFFPASCLSAATPFPLW